MPVPKRKPPPEHRPMFAKRPRTGKDGPSLRARQRANIAAMRDRVHAILERTAAGRAYFTALIAGRPAVKPKIIPERSRLVAGVTPIPYGAAMLHHAPVPVHPPPVDDIVSIDVDLDDELFARLEIFAQLVGRPVNDVADYILDHALPQAPALTTPGVARMNETPVMCPCCNKGTCKEPVLWRGRLRCGCTTPAKARKRG